MTRKHSFLLLKSLSFFHFQLRLHFKHKIPVTVTKSSFKHKILVTRVYKKFLQTENSGYSYKNSFKQNIPVTVTKVPSNTIFWLQFTKSSFKHKIPITVTKVPSNKIFWLQLQKFLQTQYSGYSLKKFLQTQNSGYNSLQKVPSNTRFWLQQFTKSSFKPKIPVTVTKVH